MPYFDIVSKIDSHELSNAVDQANRELTTRYDFRGVNAEFSLGDFQVMLVSDADFQLQQMLEILKNKLVKRQIDVCCLQVEDYFASGKQVKQEVKIRQGLDKPLTKSIVKSIKEAKLKVQAAVQGEQVRVTGKKRDDLQAVIALLREKDWELPLQFENFRD